MRTDPESYEELMKRALLKIKVEREKWQRNSINLAVYCHGVCAGRRGRGVRIPIKTIYLIPNTGRKTGYTE